MPHPRTTRPTGLGRALVAMGLLGCAGPDPAETPTRPVDSGGDPAVDNTSPADFDEDHLLVVSSMNRVDTFTRAGSRTHSWMLDQVVEQAACDGRECRAEGVTADTDGLLVNWAVQGRDGDGGLLRLDPSTGTLTPSWSTSGWVYPHEVVRIPGEEVLVVADSFLDALLWVPDDPSMDPDGPLATLGGDLSGTFDAHVPNGLALLEADDRIWLLTSYRGSDPADPGNEEGKLALWDVTDRDAPVLAWFHPPTGTLLGSHNPSLHRTDTGWLLVYAHSDGHLSETGSIGIATLPDLMTAPTYVADLIPAADNWGYPRGAILTPDGTLIVTDTTTAGGGPGAVWFTRIPEGLTAPGLGGSVAEGDQVFVTVDATLFVDGFEDTYRSTLWAPTW